MGKVLGFQDLIWVVPCVGGIVYPRAESAESMYITILGGLYEVRVQYHKLRNITYVLLDAPIFRAQTKLEPYPARMDDLTSAVYYSTWNQCIAHARYPIFWGLDHIGQLPNPDPSDTAEFNHKLHDSTTLEIDESFEDERPVLRRQAQEWAGLDLDPEAELMVFVGRCM
jgi:hypothetical protein